MSQVMYPRACTHRESRGSLLRLRLSHPRSAGFSLARPLTCARPLRRKDLARRGILRQSGVLDLDRHSKAPQKLRAVGGSGSAPP